MNDKELITVRLNVVRLNRVFTNVINPRENYGKGGGTPPEPGVEQVLLLEDGSDLLLEDGSVVLLEKQN